MLINAPFKRNIFEALILDDDSSFGFSLTLSVIAISLTIILYQAITTYVFGASLGKLFFGLQVNSIWTDKKPSFSNCLMRASTWLLGVITLGFSFSSVMSNSRRRSLHDRISETIVVSTYPKSVSPPTVVESSIVKGAFAGFLAFLLLVLSISIYESYEVSNEESYLQSYMEDQGDLCAAVGQSYREWPEDNLHTPERLNVAMTLFAAGAIGKECLDAEVGYLFQQERTSGLAYLAKAFIQS